VELIKDFKMANTSMSNILKLLKGAFQIPKKPLTPLPPPLLMTGANLRTGLSAKDIAARIIARQGEAGAPVGDLFSESGNISETMEIIRIQEIINALHLEGKIEIVVPPGVQVSTVGVGNAGAPVVSQGTTINMAIGQGVIR
jgi:hypothetical protein